MNYSIPAYLSNFEAGENRRTIAKLDMFYIGETADGRIFDEEFANSLLESLPDTPVVAFYDEEREDFLGHNWTQYIYGHVKSDAHNEFVEKDGHTWFRTEVVLYTDRIDNIGEVAQKIVGHAQSLEMDPESVEYEVFKDQGQTKIKFRKAKLAGLSVLGSNQAPAFTGSEFFIDHKEMRERFEKFFSCLEHKERGESMEEFKEKEVIDSNPSAEEEKPEEKEQEFKSEEVKSEEVQPEENKEEPKEDEKEEPKEDEKFESDSEEEEKGEEEENNDDSKEEEKDEQEFSSNIAALSDSEREELETLRQMKERFEQEHSELEAFRLEKRVALVNSYKDELPAELISSYISLAESASYEQLEARLAIDYRKFSKENKKNNDVAFSLGTMFNAPAKEPEGYAALVARYSKK